MAYDQESLLLSHSACIHQAINVMNLKKNGTQLKQTSYIDSNFDCGFHSKVSNPLTGYSFVLRFCSLFHFQFSFVFNINELLKTQQKTELQKRLNLERKLQILSAESTATGQTSGRYFLLEPSPLSTCVRCRACLARSEQNTTSCRYHSHLPLRYPAWKHFADSLTSPHNHKTHYKYWPCCRYLGIVEPDGCKEESTHIFHS